MYIANQHQVEPAFALEYAQKIGSGEFVSLTANPSPSTDTFTPCLEATRLPFVIWQDGDELILEAHMAKVNPQWQNPGNALMIVTGADAHIAGHMLPTETEFARLPQVPTWDYMTVHIHGTFEVKTEESWKLAHLERMVERFEPIWRIDTHSTMERIRHALPALVGIRMKVTQVRGKAKFHQQLDSKDIANLAQILENTGSTETAQCMRSIAIPWAKEREKRVSFARHRPTLPITKLPEANEY